MRIRGKRILAAFISAAILSSCEKEMLFEGCPEEEGVTVELTVTDRIVNFDSKTSYTNGIGVDLEGTEKIALYYKPAGASKMTVTSSVLATPVGDHKYSFTVPAAAGNAKWIPIMPYSSTLVGQNSEGSSVSLRLGPVQFPKANSFDPQADILAGKPFDLDVEEGQRTAEISAFKRVFAPLRIRVKGIPTGEKIYAFSFTSDQAPTKFNSLNGLYYLIPDEDFSTTRITNGLVGSTGNAMSAVYKDGLSAIDGTWPVWLVVNPATLSAGSHLTFSVSTESRTYTRTITLTAPMEFLRGELNDLGINITGAGYSVRESSTYVFLGSTTNGWTMQNHSFYTEANSALPAGALRFVNANGAFTFPDKEITRARIYTHPTNRSRSDLEVSLTVNGTDRYFYNLAAPTATPEESLPYKGGYIEMTPPDGYSSLGGLQVRVGSNQTHLISAITLFPTPYVPNSEDLAVDQTLFEMIDWSYTPLLGIKELYDEGRYKQSADALLAYFKNRTEVINPEVSIPVKSMSAAETRIANDALPENGYRFCVHFGNFYESVADDIYTYYSFSDGAGGINWEYEAPDAGTEFYQKHWHAWFVYLARMYNLTKQDKYFDAWKYQYTDWMANYPCPSRGIISYTNTPGSYGYKSWCELSMATRIKNQTDIFEYFKNAPGFDFDWLTTFLKAFDECVQYSMTHLYYTENSNIRFSQYKSHCLAGMLFPELKNASTWLTAGATQVTSAFSISFNDDGCLEELDFGYHTGEIENYRLVYNAAKSNNRLDCFPSDYLDNLYNACKFVADYVYPFYQNEVLNETKLSTKNVIKRWLGYYSDMFPTDNKFKYLGSDRTSGVKPTETLSLYTTSGYYMFHSDWLENSMMLIYKNNYNPNNMWHSHLDNGTVAICNKGRMFLPAPGSYTYGDGNGGALDQARAEHKAARNHNTVTKNLADIPITNSQGQYLTSYSQDGVDCVVAENTSYSGLTHRRAVWMVDKSFFVVADACYGTASGCTLNLNWHLMRDATLGTECVVFDDYRSGFAYGAHTVFGDGNNMVFKSFADTSSGFNVETGLSYTSDKIGSRYQRKYYRINVSKTTSSSTPRFITVICPCSAANEINVSASFPNAFNSQGETVNVTLNGVNYSLSYTL